MSQRATETTGETEKGGEKEEEEAAISRAVYCIKIFCLMEIMENEEAYC